MRSNNNILDIYLAEELARAYDTALQANLRELDLRAQVNTMREHIASLDDNILDRDNQLAVTTERHNRLAISNERYRLRIEAMEQAMTTMRNSLARYRAESANAAFRRIPASFRPVLRRVQANLAEERRVRRRLDFDEENLTDTE